MWGASGKSYIFHKDISGAEILALWDLIGELGRCLRKPWASKWIQLFGILCMGSGMHDDAIFNHKWAPITRDTVTVDIY